jgi:hypothetical protein
MANELSITTTMAFIKGNYSQSFVPSAFSLTVSGTKYVKNVQNIGTTIEALSVGDMTTPGYLLAINRDATNYVELYAVITDTVPFAKLKAGEPCLIRLGCTAPAAKANTASINLEYLIIED